MAGEQARHDVWRGGRADADMQRQLSVDEIVERFANARRRRQLADCPRPHVRQDNSKAGADVAHRTKVPLRLVQTLK